MQGDYGSDANLQMRFPLYTNYRARSCKSCFLTQSQRYSLAEDFVWRHDKKRCELDKLLVKDHDAFYDLRRIPDQQDNATLLIDISADTEVTNAQDAARGPCVPRKNSFWIERSVSCGRLLEHTPC